MGQRESIEEELIPVLREKREIEGATTKRVQSRTVRFLRGTKETTQEIPVVIGGILAGAVRAAGEVGAELGLVVKGAVIGAIRAAGEVTAVSVHVVRDTVRSIIKSSDEVGANTVVVARYAVRGSLSASAEQNLEWPVAAFGISRGVMLGAADIDGDEGLLACGAIRGAINSAHQASADVGEVISSAAKGLISGTIAARGDGRRVARYTAVGAMIAAQEEDLVVDIVSRSVASGVLAGIPEENDQFAQLVENTLQGTLEGARANRLDAQAAGAASAAGFIDAASEKGVSLSEMGKVITESVASLDEADPDELESLTRAVLRGALKAAAAIGQPAFLEVRHAMSGSQGTMTITVDGEDEASVSVEISRDSSSS